MEDITETESDEVERNGTYYFIRDVLGCFPNKFTNNFIGVANRHSIAKEITRLVLKDEIKEKKQSFQILAGVLILQNNFLHQSQRGAIYEVIEIVEELKYCFKKDSRKTIKKLSAETILRLFVTLYFEYVIMPGRKGEGKEFLDIFKSQFSPEDIIEAFNLVSVPRLLFERHGIELGFGDQVQNKLNEVINKFYNIEK